MTKILKLFQIEEEARSVEWLRAPAPCVRVSSNHEFVEKLFEKKSIYFTFTMIRVVVVGMLEFVEILLAKKQFFTIILITVVVRLVLWRATHIRAEALAISRSHR